MRGRRKTIPEVVRFLKFVDVRGVMDCWPWTGHCFDQGYGEFRQFKDGKLKSVIASRASYELLVGPFDPSLHVLHHCDNPSCVNPNHLFLGTMTDNMRDMADKGRSAGSKKTHCPSGHPYSVENTYYRIRRGHTPTRGCRTCRKAIDRRAKAKARAKRSEDNILRGEFAKVTATK